MYATQALNLSCACKQVTAMLIVAWAGTTQSYSISDLWELMILIQQFMHSSLSVTGDPGGLRDHIPLPGRRRGWKPSHIVLLCLANFNYTGSFAGCVYFLKVYLRAMLLQEKDFNIACCFTVWRGKER